jgi:hypothetical protein
MDITAAAMAIMVVMAPMQVQEDTPVPGIPATLEDRSEEFLIIRDAGRTTMAQVMSLLREMATQYLAVPEPGHQERHTALQIELRDREL